jgi:hypothetical protein
MGAVTVTRNASGKITAERLRSWFNDELADMASESGTDAYCGNWNSNTGLLIVNNVFTESTALAYAEKHATKRGSVLAFRIGDFSKVWPVTKVQKDIQERTVKLEAEVNEFDYRILERAQAQKSKTKKCAHCESSINIHKIQKPELKELTQCTSGGYDSGLTFRFGRYILSSYFGMTDCPVCSKNLLKTDTDKKNQASLIARLTDTQKKRKESQDAHAKEQLGKPQPYWLVTGDCGC